MKFISKIAAVVGPAIVAIGLAVPAQAVPISPEFCDAIDNSLDSGLTYGQIIVAAGIGAAEAGVPSDIAAEILVESVVEYCPEHLEGLYYAAQELS